MNDGPSPSESERKVDTAEKAEARAAEAAAIRRRWITLGEVLAVAAVLISALTLWNSWSERSENDLEKSSEAKRASTRAATLTLLAAQSDKRELALKPASADQSVQSQTISFPIQLNLAPVETTGEPRIEAAWFENALKRARDKAKLPDDSRGDERLPILIATRFIADGATHEDVALYDIGYTVTGRMLGGHSVTLQGLSLASRVQGSGAQKALDARWEAKFGQAR